MAYIDAVAALLYGRNRLQADLYEQQGSFFNLMRKDDEALRAYQKSLDLITPLSLLSELNRMNDKVAVAQLLVKRGALGDKQKADALYFDVYTYKWFLVPDRTIVEGLKELYIEAGVGLINLRRGNEQKLTILKNLLIPSAEAFLQPELDEAIKAAHAGVR